MIMKATAYAFGQRDRANHIECLGEDLELLVGQAVFRAHVSCQFTACPTAAGHIVEAAGCDIEFGAADRTRKGRLSSNPFQDLVAPLFVPERRPNIPWRGSQPVSTVELNGLLRRAIRLGARGRTIVARLRDLGQNLLLGREPLGPVRRKPDPGNLAAANENIFHEYYLLQTYLFLLLCDRKIHLSPLFSLLPAILELYITILPQRSSRMYWANYDKAHSLQKVYLQSDELSRNSRLDMAVPMPNHCPTLASNSSQKLATSRRSSSLSACSNSCGSSRTAFRRRRRSQNRSRNVDPMSEYHTLRLFPETLYI